MKRRIMTSIALVLTIVFVSLMISDTSANAQNQLRPVADSGFITLGPNQILRLTVAAADINGDDNIRVRFRRTEYIEQGNVYKVASQNTSAAITLAPGEAVGYDHIGNFNIRGVVLSSSRKVKVQGIVFDTSTQRVVTFINTTFDDESIN